MRSFIILTLSIIIFVLQSMKCYDQGFTEGKLQAETITIIEYIEIEPEPEVESESELELQKTSQEKFTITAYCPCEKCCGKSDAVTVTGTTATAGRTIAVDPTVIPYGSIVIIDGHEYVAEDCGGAIKGNRIDIFFDTHEAALQFGRQEMEVLIYRSGEVI